MNKDPIQLARDFAIAAHGDQRYGNQPYAVHLDAVAALLQPYGEEAQVVGFLHDTVEDTSATLDDICSIFGDHVSACVALVTDEQASNRAQRKAATHAKLAKVSAPLHLALIVKAADRLANLRASAADAEGGKLSMYAVEHPAFHQATYRPGLCDPLWAEMDRILAGRK